MRVLVIDDTKLMRVIASKHLRELGAEVLDAESGQMALDCIRTTGPFDLALVDWHMPEMNGLCFVQQVRSNPELASMRLLMFTTQSELSQIPQAVQLGANGYLLKPFTKLDIENKLRELQLLS